MEAYPAELKETPRPLVAALGPKDIQARVLPVLRSINEEFSPQVQVKSLSFDHRYVFPTKKDKSMAPSPSKGIWKAGWLKKHHEVLPSVVLLFYAFEPRLATRDWAIQETVIRDEVEDLRRTLSGRDVKILLVLVQLLDDATTASPSSASSSSMVNLPSSDDRLQSLRKRAELDAKSVWLLKDIVSRTHPTLIKLEAAIRTNAIEYYKTQAKRVKKAKKPTKLVAVRHSIKVAHYYEFRKYTTKMLLHYEAAYKGLLHLAADDAADIHAQVAAVAEYVHFKLIYHAIFSSHHLKGAVDQLHRHMAAFSRLPPSIAAFAKKDDAGALTCAHWAFVSRQYHVFGQLVLESQRLGLHSSASNYQANAAAGLDSDLYKEAYLYFSAAAKYATWRRKAAAKAGLSYDVSLDPGQVAPPVTIPSPFLGGDAVHPAAEKTVPHAALAIQLLSQAIHHVTVHLNHRYRLKHRLLIRLGLEQLANGEYAVARQGLEKAKTAYIQERWYGQVSQVLSHLVVCATHQRDTTAFLELSVQLLSPKLELFVAPAHRDTLHANLFVAFDQLTKSPPDLALDSLKNVVSVHVDFGKAGKAFVRETVTLTATVESYLPVDVSLHALSFLFTPENTFNQHLSHETADLRLPPHTPRTFEMSLTLPPTQTTVTCQQVRLVFRNRHDVSWTWTVTSFVPQTLLTRRNSLLAEMEGVIPGMGQGAGSPSFQRKPTASMDFEDADMTTVALDDGDGRLAGRGQLVVIQPKARATLDLLCSQVLVGDTAPLQFVLHSHHDHIHDPQYTLVVADSPTSPGGAVAPPRTADLVDLPTVPVLTSSQLPHSEQPFTVWLRCSTAREVVLNVHLTYRTALGVQVSLDTSFTVHAVAPFSLASTLHWTYPSQAARVGSPFTVVAKLAATAPLHLQSVGLTDVTGHATVTSAAATTFHPKKLGAGDHHSVVLRVLPHHVVPTPHCLGHVVVQWASNADNSGDSHVVTTELALPMVAFASVPLTADVDVPPFGVEGQLSCVRLRLTNHTTGMVGAAVKVANEGSDFLVTGAVEAKIEVLPLETYAVSFGLVPLHPGHLKLPSIEVVHVDSRETFVAPDQRMALFVVPHNHGMAPTPTGLAT